MSSGTLGFCYGVPNWPPVWTSVDGVNKFPKGEVGILSWVASTGIQPADSYLYINYEESSYLGCLLFDDHGFCRYVAKL